MIKQLFTIISMLAVLFLTGCAAQTKMAFQDGVAYTETETSKPIFLMTATLKNSYKTYHQPKLLFVHVDKLDTKNDEETINYAMDKKAKNESDDAEKGSSYLLRMELAPGKYVLRGLSSLSSSFPIHGSFFTPIHENIATNGSGIFYLGHIEATVRERTGDEFKAGSSIPLIDQAIAGASGGTFDIEISDQWETDESLFRTQFSALATVDIKKAILPKFDRARAQKWWEDH